MPIHGAAYGCTNLHVFSYVGWPHGPEQVGDKYANSWGAYIGILSPTFFGPHGLDKYRKSMPMHGGGLHALPSIGIRSPT